MRVNRSILRLSHLQVNLRAIGSEVLPPGASGYDALMAARDSSDTAGQQRRRDVLTVSQLNREARRLLESGFPILWVEGEISNLARPGSGHWYFSLKDAGAQVRCAMFRQRNRLLTFKPQDGQQVQLRAKVSLYEPRGDYQLIVDFMEEAGEGALRRAFEILKQKLDAEGLFAAEHKLALPTLPRCIGVVSSPTGAAIRDILKVLRRRFPAIEVIVYPVPVQGEGAAAKIAAMLGTAARRKECDVLILARGGGSLEDLWAFNEEVLARALFACPIPVVCGVGHEVDVTIADLVADLRAPTPSAAAELIVPDREQWLRSLGKLARRSTSSMSRLLARARERFGLSEKRLLRLHPAQTMQQYGQRSDELEQRMLVAMQSMLRDYRGVLAEQFAHLRRLSPAQRMANLATKNDALLGRLTGGMRRRLEAMRSRLAVSTATLDAISPLATLSRGYAILQRAEDGSVVRRAAQVRKDEMLTAQLGDGKLRTQVIDIIEDDSK